MAKRDGSTRWITPQEFQELAQKSATPASVRGLAIRKQFLPEIDRKAIDEERRSVPFRISSGARDRDRDTINPAGWQLENYRRNPVVLWAHDYSGLPVARAVSVEARPDALLSVAEFVPRDLSPFADTVYQMIRGGFLNATSVGFRPQAWVYNEEARGVDFSEQELLEYSIVPVPANPDALIEARSAGIDLAPLCQWAEKTLDLWHEEPGLWLPKSQVEAVFQAIGGRKTLSLPAATEEKPYPNEHACRLRDPGDFQDGSFRRVDREHEGRRYAVIQGRLRGEDTLTDQACRYPKDGWTVAQARAHCRSHNGIAFEPAAGEAAPDAAEARGYNPSAFPVERSFEWIGQRLQATAKDYLTQMRARVRPQDFCVVPATFQDRALVGVIGMDRPFADDVCYEVAWTETDGRPAWSGEPREVNVEVHAEIVPVLREARAAALKVGRVLSGANERRLREAARMNQQCHDEITAVLAQVSQEPDEEMEAAGLEIADQRSADPAQTSPDAPAKEGERETETLEIDDAEAEADLFELASLEDVTADVAKILAEELRGELAGVVRDNVTSTINRLRGRID